MCGICGLYHADGQPVDTALLGRMIATLHHRGPDDEGHWSAGPVGLATARLAIIDLSPAGHQPMSNEDGTVWIALNGEVYNFPELRQQAVQRGHRLASRTDTETILHLYEDLGTDCVHLLRGMFSFALWDGRAQRLFLARDRMGQKPLFYYWDGTRLAFASEIKALLECPWLPREINIEAVPTYLTYGYVPSPDTMFRHIHVLPPGHTLIIEDGRLEVAEYWDVAYDKVEYRSENECVEELQARLREAVRLRLVSDVPLGAFLSGGIDSTAIVALMSEVSDQPVQTFAIGFAGERSFNELEHARRAADQYSTDHHEFVVEPDAVGLLPKLVWHYDQPFADSSAIPTYLVSQLTRQHVTVALNGDGGDELFAGYERFAAAHLAERWNWVPHDVWRAAGRLLRVLPESTGYRDVVRRARRFVEAAGLPCLDRYLSWVGLFSADLRRKVLTGRTEMDVRTSFRRCLDQVKGRDPISQLLYLNTKTYLPDDLLVKTDRMSMAHGLEARSPFLDHELAQWAAGLPIDLKLQGTTTKYLLKRAMRGLVPDGIIYRPKHGFGVPVGRWFRSDLSGYVRETLLSSRALDRGYFRPDGLRWLVEQHQTGQRDFGHQLWTLLTLEVWHRIFLDGDSL